MDSSKWIKENFSQDKAQQFGEILKEAVRSYAANRDSSTVQEWLHGYLTEQLSDKNPEEINVITNSIINTVTTFDNTVSSLRNAVQSGKSVEAWFQEETASTQQANGQQAYTLTDAYAALTKSSNQYAEPEEQQEVIEVEAIPVETWEDGNWNKYKMKELVTETVRQAGDTALRTTASDLCEKVTEYGFQTVLTDKELVKESLLNGADAGLKVAVSGAMEVADARGLLPDPDSDTESRSIIACMAIENVKTFGKIAKGEIGLADGLKEIKETSVSALATIVKTKVAAVGAKVGQRIGEAVGSVFGPVGTAVGHFVGGAVGKMAGTAVGQKIVETAKKVSSAAKSVVSRVTSTVRSIGNTIKSGLRKLFSW